MNILILGNTAGLTNDFILKTFPNQAVFIFGHTGVKNSRKNKITVYTKHYENNQLEDVFDFHDYDQIIYFSEYLNYGHESSGEIENLIRLLECLKDQSLEDIASLMGIAPNWMPDSNLRANGYECSFYQKD